MFRSQANAVTTMQAATISPMAAISHTVLRLTAEAQAYHQEPAQQAPASYQSGSNSDFQDMPLDDDLPF